MTPRSRALLAAVVLGLAGFSFLPWYALEDGFFGLAWLGWFPFDPETAPAVLQSFEYERPWLLGVLPFVLAPLLVLKRGPEDRPASALLIAAGSGGLIYALLQGWLIGPLGIQLEVLVPVFEGFEGKQYGMGAGAILVLLSHGWILAEGLAARGLAGGDRFVSSVLVFVVSTVTIFVLLPLATILLRGVETDEGRWSLELLLVNLASPRLWSIRGDLGVAWDSLLLAVLTGAGTTLLGLVCALAATRTGLRRLPVFRLFSLLPIVTPPFVLGLALILLFGRSGAVTTWLETSFGIPASRYIFGLPGVLLAQLLAFTPVAFMILTGAIEAVSPTLEEAAQTLRASRTRILWTVTLPLVRPALANSFLVGFVESLADFGNPLVLGGSSFQVLATEIYFAIAGAQSDAPRASAMALVLLAFTLGAFVAQRRWVAGAAYTAVGGKGDVGAAPALPRGAAISVAGVTILWTLFTIVVYGVVIAGGFVENIGRDHRPTLEHYTQLFGSASGASTRAGGAWPSLLTTLGLAALAAPITAIVGLLTAWLIARQNFRAKAAFELGTMLSFAVPGTVIGVAYVLAFNAPPFELTGTAAILVIAFVFRNMPVGIRAGIASLSQIDRSLDEASLTLGATSGATLRRVLVPLLRPAIAAALVYGFARAMTAVSAVIFLVSAEHNLATTYILSRVESGEYGPAIAYSSVLIVVMLVVIGSVQRLAGSARLGRRGPA